MLSYLKENSVNDSAETEKPQIEEANESSQEEYLTPSTGGNKNRKTTILAGVIVVIGVLGLTFMIKESKSTALGDITNETAAKMDQAIAQLTNLNDKKNSEINTIIDTFYKYSDFPQVQVSQLRKNPFRVIVTPFASNSLETNDGNVIHQAPESKHNQVAEEKVELKLQSIMNVNNTHSCMINDVILRVNDAFEGYVVEDIDSHSVTLKQNDSIIKLTLQNK